MPKKIWSGRFNNDWVRVTRQDRHFICVEVWKDTTIQHGDADGEWSMPILLGELGAVSQACVQTEKRDPEEEYIQRAIAKRKAGR